MTKRMVWALIASYLCAVLMAGAAVVISTKVAKDTDQESNRRWCTLLITLDSAYKQIPPTSRVGSNIAHQIHELRIDFGC